jgi:hypothetical protein
MKSPFWLKLPSRSRQVDAFAKLVDAGAVKRDNLITVGGQIMNPVGPVGGITLAALLVEPKSRQYGVKLLVGHAQSGHEFS